MSSMHKTRASCPPHSLQLWPSLHTPVQLQLERPPQWQGHARTDAEQCLTSTPTNLQDCSGNDSREAGMQADQVAETLSTCRFAQRMMQVHPCRGPGAC